jgi:hypothetical protein
MPAEAEPRTSGPGVTWNRVYTREDVDALTVPNGCRSCALVARMAKAGLPRTGSSHRTSVRIARFDTHLTGVAP